jgi:hypothetical protein
MGSATILHSSGDFGDLFLAASVELEPTSGLWNIRTDIGYCRVCPLGPITKAMGLMDFQGFTLSLVPASTGAGPIPEDSPEAEGRREARILLVEIDVAIDRAMRKRAVMIPSERVDAHLARATFLRSMEGREKWCCHLRQSYIHLSELLEDVAAEPIVLNPEDLRQVADLLARLGGL